MKSFDEMNQLGMQMFKPRFYKYLAKSDPNDESQIY